MYRLLALGMTVCALALTVASGFVHGYLGHRWGPTLSMQAEAQRLAEFPERFGAWTLVDVQVLGEDVTNMLQCSGSLLRTYVHQQTGERVTVSVIQGPAGPISVHTPEICYSSRNYMISEKRHMLAITDSSGETSEFWSLTFKSRDVDESLLSVCYGWTTDGNWRAPNSARFAMAGQHYLYKIQLASNPLNMAENNPCESFLQDFVPELRRLVFQPTPR